jgi:hypothetical protein
MSESAYDADSTVVNRLVSAVGRCVCEVVLYFPSPTFWAARTTMTSYFPPGGSASNGAISRESRMSESAYDADSTVVNRLVSAVGRCVGGDKCEVVLYFPSPTFRAARTTMTSYFPPGGSASNGAKSRMSESAYDADSTVVNRLVSAVGRCVGGDNGDDAVGVLAPLLALPPGCGLGHSGLSRDFELERHSQH